MKKELNPESIEILDNHSRKLGVLNTFYVDHTYKGTLERGENITVLTGDGISDRGYNFQIGQFYIVF